MLHRVAGAAITLTVSAVQPASMAPSTAATVVSVRRRAKLMVDDLSLKSGSSPQWADRWPGAAGGR